MTITEAARNASAPAVAHAIAAQIVRTYGKDAPALAGMVSDEVSRLSRDMDRIAHAARAVA